MQSALEENFFVFVWKMILKNYLKVLEVAIEKIRNLEISPKMTYLFKFIIQDMIV